MEQTLENFLATRKAKIKAQIKDLRAELRQIAAAEEAAKVALGPRTAGKSKLPGEQTIKDQVVELLSATDNGLNAKAILEGLRQSFARELERSSLSPQLSRLKNEGTLILEGKVWKLSPSAQDVSVDWREEKYLDLKEDPGEMPGSEEDSEGWSDPDELEGEFDDPF